MQWKRSLLCFTSYIHTTRMVAGNLVTTGKSSSIQQPKRLLATIVATTVMSTVVMSTLTKVTWTWQSVWSIPGLRGGWRAPLHQLRVWEERAWGWCTPTHIFCPVWHPEDLQSHQSCCHRDDRSCTRSVPLLKAVAVYNFPPSAHPPCVNRDGS